MGKKGIYTNRAYRQAQAFLIIAGHDGELVADGVWGENSEQALTDWQKENALEPSDGQMTGDIFQYMYDEETPLPESISLKQYQAIMILDTDYDDENDLIADGIWGNVTPAVIRHFLSLNLDNGLFPENCTWEEETTND